MSIGRCLIGVVLSAAALAVAASSVRAQEASPDAGPAHSAQWLAARSVDCLIRGEDAPTRSAQLAAYAEGFELATRAVAADETNADAHFALFANQGRLALLERGARNPFKLINLRSHLERALELNPNQPDALTAKGGLLRQLPRLLGGNLDEAADYLRHAVALDPDNVGARLELARTYRDLGQPERGVPLVEAAARIAERRGRERKAVEARTLLQELSARR